MHRVFGTKTGGDRNTAGAKPLPRRVCNEGTACVGGPHGQNASGPESTADQPQPGRREQRGVGRADRRMRAVIDIEQDGVETSKMLVQDLRHILCLHADTTIGERIARRRSQRGAVPGDHFGISSDDRTWADAGRHRARHAACNRCPAHRSAQTGLAHDATATGEPRHSLLGTMRAGRHQLEARSCAVRRHCHWCEGSTRHRPAFAQCRSGSRVTCACSADPCREVDGCARGSRTVPIMWAGTTQDARGGAAWLMLERFHSR